jgi:hypothetical protein
MSFSYEARFGPLGIPFVETFARLDVLLQESAIFFDGEAMRVESEEGGPVPSTGLPIAAENLTDVAKMAQKWWGVGFFAASQPLMEELGRTDAMEVTFTLFHSPTDLPLLIYSEHSSAERARRESETLAGDLYTLLVRLAAGLRSDLVIYDEEAEGGFILPDIEEVRTRLAKARESESLPEICIAISSRLMSFEEGRKLAGRWADRVRLTTTGYTLFAFLS